MVAGHLSKVDRVKGAPLAAVDVEDVPDGLSVVALVLPTDRAWVRTLALGVCVDVWSEGRVVTASAALKVVGSVPRPGEEKTLVHLLGPIMDGVPGKVLAAKDLTLSVVRCRSAGDDVWL